MRTVIALAALILVLLPSPAFDQPAYEQPPTWLSNLHMLDARIGWAQGAQGGSGNFAKGAIGLVVRTTDGGILWRDVRPADPAGRESYNFFFLLQALTSKVAWATGGGLGVPLQTLFRTVDGGQTWEPARWPQGVCIDSLYFINPHDGWIICGDAVYRSTDGGATWERIGSANRSRQGRIIFLNATTGWIAGFRSTGSSEAYQLITRDGGRTWQRQALPLPTQFASAAAEVRAGVPKFFSARDGILLVSYYGAQDFSSEDTGVLLYVTHDGGRSWTYTTPLIWKVRLTASGILTTGPWSASFADINHAWVTAADFLYVTKDGGRRWMKVQPGKPFGDTVLLDFISPTVGWAPGGWFAPPYLLKTVDGGWTWKTLSYSISP